MINPILNQITAVDNNDAAWTPDPNSTIPVEPDLGAELKLEFSTPDAVAACMQLMKASGINIDELVVHDSIDNWNYPGFKKLTYLREDGPRLFSFKGKVTTRDGIETPIDVNVGFFINVKRVMQKGITQPVPDDFGDNIGVYFINPNFPVLVWTKQ